MQIIILVIFVIQSNRQRRLCYERNIEPISNYTEFDVIIAAREDATLIRNCLSDVIAAGFQSVILCIDGGHGSVYRRIKEDFPSITVLYNEQPLGKVKSQIKCLRLSTKDKVLILDADILLFREEVPFFLSYYVQTKVDFLCPYSVGVSSNKKSILFAIAETDRHMRQRIVRAGRDAYGVSNLSGYCMLANRKKYINIIDTDAIQDDVIATINLLRENYTVKTYHRPVCSEIERETFQSYLMQKTRWTAGNIMLIKSYNKLFCSTTFDKAFAFSSSFLLWYWASWMDFFAFFVALFHPVIFVFLLIEGVVKFWGLFFAGKPESRNIAILSYLIVWPVFSTMCLLLSPYYLSGRIIEQKTRR